MKITIVSQNMAISVYLLPDVDNVKAGSHGSKFKQKAIVVVEKPGDFRFPVTKGHENAFEIENSHLTTFVVEDASEG